MSRPPGPWRALAVAMSEEGPTFKQVPARAYILASQLLSTGAMIFGNLGDRWLRFVFVGAALVGIFALFVRLILVGRVRIEREGLHFSRPRRFVPLSSVRHATQVAGGIELDVGERRALTIRVEPKREGELLSALERVGIDVESPPADGPTWAMQRRAPEMALGMGLAVAASGIAAWATSSFALPTLAALIAWLLPLVMRRRVVQSAGAVFVGGRRTTIVETTIRKTGQGVALSFEAAGGRLFGFDANGPQDAFRRAVAASPRVGIAPGVDRRLLVSVIAAQVVIMAASVALVSFSLMPFVPSLFALAVGGLWMFAPRSPATLILGAEGIWLARSSTYVPYVRMRSVTPSGPSALAVATTDGRVVELEVGAQFQQLVAEHLVERASAVDDHDVPDLLAVEGAGYRAVALPDAHLARALVSPEVSAVTRARLAREARARFGDGARSWLAAVAAGAAVPPVRAGLFALLEAPEREVRG
jgi:hypothetical protein